MTPRSFPAFFSRLVAALLLTAIFAFYTVPVTTVHAALWNGYDAELLSVQSPAVIAAGDRAEVTVNFRNDGDKAWQVSSRDYVSLYSWDPVKKIEVRSAYADASWKTAAQPSRLPVTQVSKEGEVSFTFFLRAPKNPGLYSQEFILAAEGVAWLKDSRFKVTFRVPETASTGASTSSVSPSPSTAASQVFLEDASEQFTARVTNGGWISSTVEAGQDVSAQIAFQNTGEVAWNTAGVDAVQLVPVDASGRIRSSSFWHPTWVSRERVSSLSAHVSLGAEANFSFKLRAPDMTGSYRERFALVTASGKMIRGAVLELPMTVTPGSGFVATDISDIEAEVPSVPVPEQSLPSVQVATDNGYLASSVIGSGQELSLLGNGRQQITIGWRNGGTVDWTKMGVKPVSSDPWVRASYLMDTTWSDNRPPEATVQVRASETGFYSFYIKAPPRKGTYALVFRLFANGQAVKNSDVTVYVRVSADGVIPIDDVVKPATPSTPSTPSSPSTPTQPAIAAQPLSGDVSTLPSEPVMRVGIYQPPQNRLQVTTRVTTAEVRLQGSVVCQLALNQSVTIEYQKTSARYVLTGPDSCNGSSAQPYVVRASDGLSPLEVTDFVRPSTWITNASDNDFRTQLELRVSKDGKQVWVINELPVEWYLKGIAETSNSSPAQFQRTLLVAARTYAMYHISRGTKHANENFLVDATLDQLYRGYNIELRAPTISAAVDATRGQIVTYNGSLAITPYFSRSDGRTRSWGEVWAGGSQYPWLVSVPVPQDQGRALWGHGVGMSASGALDMANEGRAYDYILKYFYTGIELRRAYQ